MKINEVIDSSRLEDIVVDAINNTVTILKQSYNSEDISKLDYRTLDQYTKDTFISVYKDIVFRRCFKNVEVNKIKFNIVISDNNLLWYSIKEITKSNYVLYIRLNIEQNLFNSSIGSIASLFFQGRISGIDDFIKNSRRFLNFVEIQVHELTHLEQLIRKIKRNPDLQHISNLTTRGNKKIEKVKNSSRSLSRHFMYPNEMNAYASEISSHVISLYKKELKSSINMLDGLPRDYFAKHLEKLKQDTLSKIPEIAKARRWEINDYTKEKIYSTLLKQIYINLERKIPDLEEQALENFKEGQYEN